MRARLRVIPSAVALAMGLTAPVLAQESGSSTTPAVTMPSVPSSEEVVGPAQLRDFSLQGTVTRRAETPPQAPSPSQPEAANSRPAPTSTASAPAVIRVQPIRDPRGATLTPETPAPTASASAKAGGLPAPDQSLSFSPATLPPQAPVNTESAPIDGSTNEVAGGFVSFWPWLLALLAAVGAALWYFRRQRSGHPYAYAGAGPDAAAFDRAPLPAPPSPPRAQPRPAAPQPAPTPPPAPLRVPEERGGVSGTVVSTKLKAAPRVVEADKPAIPSLGIVSTRLRPWLDIEFLPLEASFEERQGVIQFDVTLFNSGSGPAREILLEARLFNAGADQDEAIARYFANPTVDGDRIALLEPLKRMTFRTSAMVPREQMRIFEAGGRKVWVPLIGFNAAYRWGGGEGQTSASYLLGRSTDGEKMAPFRVDLGARTFSGLAAREHTVRVRR